MSYSRQKHAEYIRERKYERKDWLYRNLESIGALICPDCGEEIEKGDICFHHPNDDKRFKILGYCLTYSEEEILKEVAKTVPMHFGCHQKREGKIQADRTDELDEYPLTPLGTEVTRLFERDVWNGAD